EEVLAAHAQVDLGGGRGEAHRAPPAHHLLWLRPRPPDGLDRRVELAHEGDLGAGVRLLAGKEFGEAVVRLAHPGLHAGVQMPVAVLNRAVGDPVDKQRAAILDRKSTRLNSSHVKISYALLR